jgi:Listeria-Bacteroides repeat domain (List_Bact_rpt)./The GLUG motif.
MMKKQLILALMLLVGMTTAHAFGGAGTATNPYLITSVAELAQLATDVNGGEPYEGEYFKLTTDLDLSADYGTGEGWMPIGDRADYLNNNPFKGHFDGDNHKIINLVIARPTTECIGLFGFIQSATIQNLGVEIGAGGVVGQNNVGGLVGFNYRYSSISNCFATGVVNSIGNIVGGLVGNSVDSSISNSFATGAVNSTGNNVGGLVGYNLASTISNSFATGAVSSTGNYVGGLVGNNASFNALTNSYAKLGDGNPANLVGGGSDSDSGGDISGIAGTLDDAWDGTVWASGGSNNYPYLLSFPTYTITFDSDVDAITVNQGMAANAPQAPSKAGFEFKCWLYDGDAWDFNTRVTEGMMLIAKWEALTLPVPTSTYAVNFVETEGVTVSRNAVNTVNEGYTFRFEVVLADEYAAGYILVVYVNGVELEPYSQTNTYLIEDIQGDCRVTFKLTKNEPTNDDPTSNEVIANAVNVWTTNGQIHIANDTSAEIRIVNIGGNILYDMTASDISVSVPSGIYVVVVGNSVKKVVVR